METNITDIVITLIIVAGIVALLVFGRKEFEQYNFMANEVVFRITHPASTTPAEIVDAMERFLRPERDASRQVSVNDTPRADRNWRNRLQPPKDGSRIITFPSENGETFSLVPISLVPFSIFRLSGHRKRDLRPRDVIRVLNAASAELSNRSLAIGTDINLRSIFPNWLTSNLHHGRGTGGPGSWPLSVPSPTQNAIHLTEQETTGGTTGRRVNVAILDTAPVSAADEAQIRVLIPTLNPVHYHNNPQNFIALRPYTPPSEHIQMPDHGTFIASIVHSVAQNAATIHLYEVLNTYGVGPFTIIAQGLQRAITDLYDGSTPLIINCSFMLRVPPGENLLPDLDVPMPALLSSIREVFESATRNRQNITIVAAAGNDASSGGRPTACYPAAFRNVIGVGALPSQNYPTYSTGRYIVASYSNLSYSGQEGELPGVGYMTFGGELDNPGTTVVDPSSSNGVRGVYVGPISTRGPTGKVIVLSPTNPSQWARWAGTSFAAPIIAGLLARNGALPNPSPDLTVEGENVIRVTQI